MAFQDRYSEPFCYQPYISFSMWLLEDEKVWWAEDFFLKIIIYFHLFIYFNLFFIDCVFFHTKIWVLSLEMKD